MSVSAHSDVENLHRMGYAQELRRRMSTFSNFAVSFTIISILSGCLTLYAYRMNTGGIRLVAILNDISVWWHLIGVVIIVGALFFIPSKHQSLSFVFTGFVNNTGFSFAGASIYVFLIGLLLAQYTFTGYDASAHMTEETNNAAVAGPRGIVWSIVISLFAGWLLLIGVTSAIQDYTAEVTAVVLPAQIFVDAVGKNLGTFLLFIVVVAQFYCGMSSVTANSRMIYAFSRDGAVPGSEFWHRINPRTRTPTNSIWFAAVGAFILGLPYLWNPGAHAAGTSIPVLGLYIAYGLPILLRLLAGEKFQRGPWHLGRWSYVIGWIALIWIGFISLLFILPQVAPGNTTTTFNYSIVAVAVVLLYSGGY